MHLDELFHFSFFLAVGCYLLSLLAFTCDLKKISFVSLLAGFVSHTGFLLSRGWLTGILIPNALFEEPFFLPWCIALTVLIVRRLPEKNSQCDSFIIPICFFSLLALFCPKDILPPNPYSQSVLSPMFFSFEVFAHACFIVGAWSALLYIGFKEKSKLFHSFIVWGFLFYSIAQVVGALWSYFGWATPFHWNNRHLISAGIWCFYAAILHLRYTPNWKVSHEAWLSILGFFILFICISWGQVSESQMQRLGG
jgi:ABC-type transport system involved in cytochrome c biogenesis permease subunit